MGWRTAAGAVTVLVALAAALTGCADGPVVEPAPLCPPGELTTLQPGTLTLATDQPAYPPWFVDDQPANGQGFESAVGYAVAERLGYPRAQVRWARVAFTTALAPGPKPFDIAINQTSITDQRREVADFSAPYYDVLQAVVATASSPAVRARTGTDLARLRLGSEAGTTGATAARSLSHSPITVFDTNDAAVQALGDGQVDALVMDLPTAQRVAADLPGGRLVGRLPQSPEGTEQYGLLLDKDSPLTACVSEAVQALRADGTLARLQQQWIPTASVPTLTG